MKTATLQGLKQGPTTSRPKSHLSKKIWIPIVIILLVAAGGYTGYRVYAQSQAAATATSTTAQLQTTVARTGDLTIYASGAGKLNPNKSLSLGFSQGGTLSEILVKVGDQVKAGQVLARVTTSNTPTSINAAISSAELDVLNAQQNLDNLNSSAETTSANALKAVEDAQTALNDLQNTDLAVATAAQAVADAQEALDTAQTAYNNAHSTGSQATIDSYYAAMLQAKAQLERAQKTLEDFDYLPNTDVRKANAVAGVSSAQQALASATYNYNAVQKTASKTDQAVADANLAAAKVKLATAQSDYEQAQKGPTAGELAVAKAKLATAQAEYEKVKDGPTAQDVAIAKASLASAQAQLELAKEKTVVVELTAPIDGMVMSIANNVGETVGTGTFITLDDVSQMIVLTYLDESDMGKASVGLEADVVFDALPDKTYVGKVVEISPSLTSVSNISAVSVMVQLDSTKADTSVLKIGMNGTVDIIGGRATNAVLVPVEALREIGTNEYAVFVMVNGEPTLRTVEVGIKDLTSAEIKSGLKAGDVVTTGVVQTKSSTTTTTSK